MLFPPDDPKRSNQTRRRARPEPPDPLEFYTHTITPGDFLGGGDPLSTDPMDGRVGLPVALQEAATIPTPERADTSLLTAAERAATSAYASANREQREQAMKDARMKARLHLYTQGIGAPLQWMTGVGLGLPDGADAVQAASRAGAVAAEGRAQNALRQAEEQANVARIESEADQAFQRQDYNRRLRQAELDTQIGNANANAMAGAARDVIELNRTEELQAWQRERQRQADARAAANAATARERQERQDALARLEVLGKLGMMNRATDEEIAASGFDREVLEAAYAPQQPSLPPALSAAANALMPLAGQSRGTRFFGLEPATRGYGDAEEYLERIKRQLPKLQDDLRKEWVKLSPREQQAYGQQYSALLATLGEAGDTGDASAIEAFNTDFLPLLGQTSVARGGAQAGASTAPPTVEELFAMADEIPDPPPSSPISGQGRSREERAAALLAAEGEAPVAGVTDEELDAQVAAYRSGGSAPTLRPGQEVEVPPEAVRVRLRDLVGNDLYPPSLQEAIRRNGSLDGLKVVVLDDNGAVIPFGDRVVLEDYASISSGLARARDFARRERLDVLNREQAERMRSRSAGSEPVRGVYGNGGSR